MKLTFVFFSLFATLLLGCDRNSKSNLLILKSIAVSNSKNVISLLKDTTSNIYFLNDRYNRYMISSYFTKANAFYAGGELDLIKDSNLYYTNNDELILVYTTRAYQSYTFLEYQGKKLQVKRLIELIDLDEKIVEESKQSSDTIYRLISRRVEVEASRFLSKNFAFSSLNSSVNYNFLTRNNGWTSEGENKQEMWVLRNFDRRCP